jgi:hypothetical protein
MKAMLIYRPHSEQERPALDYLRDFAAQTGKQLPTLDPDSPQGAELCQLYDIMQFPAILVTDDEGHIQNSWVGERLPPFSELSYYVDEKSALREPRQDVHV